MRISDWSSDVCSSDLSDGLFAAVVATLDRFGLSILASRIVNAHNGMSLDTFQVLAVNDRGVGRDELARTVSRRLGDILTRPLSQVRPSRRALPRHLRHFPVPTRVEFETQAKDRKRGVKG